MRKLKRFLVGVSVAGVLSATHSPMVFAENCTTTLPAGNCSLDESTTAPLTIDAGITLTIDADGLTLQHTIDSNGADGSGTIQTNGGGISVTQNAAIGGNASISNIIIDVGDSWTTNANIITNNDGTDINLGAGTAGETLNINGNSSETITITGEIDGNAGDSVSFGFDGNGGTFLMNGEVETVIVNFVSGTTTTASAMGTGTTLASTNISTNATLNVQETSITTNGFSNDGTLTLSSGASVIATTYTADANAGHFNFNVLRNDTDFDTSTLQVTTGGLDLSNDTISFNFETGTDVVGSTTIENVIRGNTTATIAPTILDNNFLYNFSLENSGTNLDLIITRQNLETAATSENNYLSSNLLLNDYALTSDATLKQIQNNIQNAATQEEYNNLIESTQPDAASTPLTVANYVSDQTISMVQSRLDYLTSTPKKGMRGVGSGDTNGSSTNVVRNKTRELAARRLRYLKSRTENVKNRVVTPSNNIYAQEELYDKSRGYEVWAQGFGGSGEQGIREQISGYQFDTLGFAFGADTGTMDDKFVTGAMFAYADTEAKSKNASNQRTDLQTYQIGLYGTYNFEDDYFGTSLLSYSMNDVTTTRYNPGGIQNTTATAEYDAEHISLFSELGKRIEYKKGIILQPSFMMNYSRMEFEDYTERGAQSANLSVQQETMNALHIGPRFKAYANQQLENGNILVPEIEASYQYDVLQNRSKTISAFQDIDEENTEFITYGFTPQNHIIGLGLGLALNTEKWKFKTDYDFKLSEDLTAHSGLIRANYSF